MKEIPFKQGNRICHELNDILQNLEKTKSRILELMDQVTMNTYVPKSIKEICSYLPVDEEKSSAIDTGDNSSLTKMQETSKRKKMLATEDKVIEILQEVLDTELEERILSIIKSSPELLQNIKGGTDLC